MDDQINSPSPFLPFAQSQNGDRINDHHLTLEEKAREEADE